MKAEEELIEGLQRQDRKAQKRLFSLYYRKMLAMCRRYVKDEFEAENCLMQGFTLAFSSVLTFRKEGSLEGWLRKIVLRECLQHLRRQHPLFILPVSEEMEEVSCQLPESPDYQLLLNLVHRLPEGYRMVFNLYAVEGYRHSEIASLLGISEGASRSQLNGARKMLRSMLAGIGIERIDQMVS